MDIKVGDIVRVTIKLFMCNEHSNIVREGIVISVPNGFTSTNYVMDCNGKKCGFNPSFNAVTVERL